MASLIRSVCSVEIEVALGGGKRSLARFVSGRWALAHDSSCHPVMKAQRARCFMKEPVLLLTTSFSLQEPLLTSRCASRLAHDIRALLCAHKTPPCVTPPQCPRAQHGSATRHSDLTLHPRNVRRTHDVPQIYTLPSHAITHPLTYPSPPLRGGGTGQRQKSNQAKIIVHDTT